MYYHHVVLSYIAVLLLYVYFDCVPVVRHPDDDHRSARNVLVKNSNTLLNICIKVHLLVYQVQGC